MDEPEYELVVPFVVCASQGGPYDDDSFAAGYQVGRIDAELAAASERLHLVWGAVLPIEETVPTALLPQLDLMAMRHGYTMQATDAHVEGWSDVAFLKIS